MSRAQQKSRAFSLLPCPYDYCLTALALAVSVFPYKARSISYSVYSNAQTLQSGRGLAHAPTWVPKLSEGLRQRSPHPRLFGHSAPEMRHTPCRSSAAYLRAHESHHRALNDGHAFTLSRPPSLPPPLHPLIEVGARSSFRPPARRRAFFACLCTLVPHRRLPSTDGTAPLHAAFHSIWSPSQKRAGAR
ncbi:hypothetical protein BJ912DRAFT_102582 [Pholiota molesta]|nr:hypothetical protein BJ912DRAFT_102582 [Pholiota molesta]